MFSRSYAWWVSRSALGVLIIVPYILYMRSSSDCIIHDHGVLTPPGLRSTLSEVCLTSPHTNGTASVPVHGRSHGEPAIVKFLHGVNWELIQRSVSNDVSRRQVLGDFILDMSEFAVIEPAVPISGQCDSAPPLLPAASIKCEGHPSGLTGRRRAKPAKVAHMFNFGFESDVLEIHLRELYDVVDYFFILEATRTPCGNIKKPLIWQKLRSQARFRPFLDKVVHIVMDDVESFPGKEAASNMWYLERHQEAQRFKKFRAWNAKQADPFTDDDLIGFGDIDEVANRDILHLLKHCEQIGEVVDIGIWFPMGQLDHAFQTDWPVPGHPYSLGEPTFHTVRHARALDVFPNYPNRNRGSSGKYLLGGMHMTRHRLLPFMILETMSITECGWHDAAYVEKLKKTMSKGTIEEIEEYWRAYHENGWKHRLIPLQELPADERNALVKVPWFLQCNHERYPYWWGERDTRFDTTP